MGKTNLLTPISQSLSFIFAKKTGEIQYEFIASSDEKVKSFESTDARYCYKEEKGDYNYPLMIKVNATEDNNDIEWEFYKENDTSGLEDTKYKNANEQFWGYHIVDGKINELPVFVYFYDSYPHVTAKIDRTKIQKKMNSGNPIPRNTAYYKWNDERNCTDLWIQ
jgi:hypothetical protein